MKGTKWFLGVAVVAAVAGVAIGISSVAGASNSTKRDLAQQPGPTSPVPPRAGIPKCGKGKHLWAVVNTDGTLARGSNKDVVSTFGFGGGWYEVIFTKNVTTAAYAVSVGDPGTTAVPGPGMAAITGRSTDARGVFVTTFDAAGTGTNRAFFVLVNC